MEFQPRDDSWLAHSWTEKAFLLAPLLEAPLAHQVLCSMTARQKPDAAILDVENYAGSAFNNITCLRESKS